MERILIVEDSPTQREMLQHTLETQGYPVTVAANGKDAWTRLAEIAPTLVITDIVMPEMDGYALCRAIKSAEAFARIPVVLLTSLSDPKDVIAGLECGADSFIGKPFAEDYLHARIRHVIANRDLSARDKGGRGIEISHDGRTHLINAERPQILDLLLSVYEVAVRRNEDLIRAQAELRTLNNELEQKVSDRTRLLEESNKSLDTFCYSIAHDLRSPLRSIQGFVTALSEEYAAKLDDTAQDYARRACSAAGRMDRLIADLLAYGRVNHGEAPVQQLDLHWELRHILADFEDRVRAKGATIELDVASSDVWASSILLRQALTNLIDNALKFTRSGIAPKIVLAVKATGSRVAISVTDSGIGIDPAFHGKIFNIFEKAHLDPTNSGTGIGLAIVQKAVERMGGEIRVESQPGRGSCFTLELPASASAPRA